MSIGVSCIDNKLIVTPGRVLPFQSIIRRLSLENLPALDSRFLGTFGRKAAGGIKRLAIQSSSYIFTGSFSRRYEFWRKRG